MPRMSISTNASVRPRSQSFGMWDRYQVAHHTNTIRSILNGSVWKTKSSYQNLWTWHDYGSAWAPSVPPVLPPKIVPSGYQLFNRSLWLGRATSDNGWSASISSLQWRERLTLMTSHEGFQSIKRLTIVKQLISLSSIFTVHAAERFAYSCLNSAVLYTFFSYLCTPPLLWRGKGCLRKILNPSRHLNIKI